jgi:transducin (beta)-like 1
MRDPDTLPFAKNIEPHTLIRLVQDGMHYDQLVAETSNVRRVDTV